MMGAAKSTAVEGAIALTERSYIQAAELFGQAAEYVPIGQTNERLSYKDRQADALERRGNERGDNNALRVAVGIYRQILEDRPRNRLPRQWAQTQVRLGTALERLGERESGTEPLKEAVAAFRASLTERTRDRAPLDWAVAQNDLGFALEKLGERETGEEFLRRL